MEKRNGPPNVIELKDLVYAPLHAVSEANMRLSSNIVDFIASTGDLNADETGKPVVHLHTMQMQYQQLRNDADDNTVAERIGLEVPLLSIYPLSSLKVAKSKVSFDVEVRSIRNLSDSVKILAQICSKRERDSANQPRFHFDVELESVPVSEGLARFVDTLNAQAVPKRINAKPLDDSGNALTGKELEEYNQRMQLMEREAELNNKLNEIKEMIRVRNISLNEKTGMDYDEYIENRNYSNETSEEPEAGELCKSIKEYKDICVDLEEQLAKLNEEKIARRFQEQPLNDNKQNTRAHQSKTPNGRGSKS